MQIVIDIPEEVEYKVYAYGLSLCPSDKEQLIHAIMNGTPLPKGHGRLIDADAYRNEMLNSREFDFFKRLDMQPTIVDADTESEVNT